MIIDSPESRRINYQNNFARNHAQEHNGQLYLLLTQLRDALGQIPISITRQLQEEDSTSSNPTISNSLSQGNIYSNSIGGSHLEDSNSSNTSSQHTSQIQLALIKAMQRAMHLVDDLSYQILIDIINVLSSYSMNILMGIHREGIVSTTSNFPTIYANNSTGNNNATSTANGQQESSLAVQTLTKQLPNILKAHLFSLPKSPLIEQAAEEFAIKLLIIYVTIAALLRPVNENTRLRTAQDMSHLEMTIAGFCSQWSVTMNSSQCPILREYK